MSSRLLSLDHVQLTLKLEHSRRSESVRLLVTTLHQAPSPLEHPRYVHPDLPRAEHTHQVAPHCAACLSPSYCVPTPVSPAQPSPAQPSPAQPSPAWPGQCQQLRWCREQEEAGTREECIIYSSEDHKIFRGVIVSARQTLRIPYRLSDKFFFLLTFNC